MIGVVFFYSFGEVGRYSNVIVVNG